MLKLDLMKKKKMMKKSPLKLRKVPLSMVQKHPRKSSSSLPQLVARKRRLRRIRMEHLPSIQVIVGRSLSYFST